MLTNLYSFKRIYIECKRNDFLLLKGAVSPCSLADTDHVFFHCSIRNSILAGDGKSEKTSWKIQSLVLKRNILCLCNVERDRRHPGTFHLFK